MTATIGYSLSGSNHFLSSVYCLLASPLPSLFPYLLSFLALSHPYIIFSPLYPLFTHSSLPYLSPPLFLLPSLPLFFMFFGCSIHPISHSLLTLIFSSSLSSALLSSSLSFISLPSLFSLFFSLLLSSRSSHLSTTLLHPSLNPFIFLSTPHIINTTSPLSITIFDNQ